MNLTLYPFIRDAGINNSHIHPIISPFRNPSSRKFPLEEIKKLKALLNSKFSKKDLRVLKYFLGFEVARNAQGISLFQNKYALDLIHDVGLTEAKP